MQLPDMIGSFVSGVTASLVAKNYILHFWGLNHYQWRDFGVWYVWTTLLIFLIWYNYLQVAPLPPGWPKIELRNISPVWRVTGLKFGTILTIKASAWLYQSDNMRGPFLSGNTTFQVAENWTFTPLIWLLAVALDHFKWHLWTDFGVLGVQTSVLISLTW